MKKITALLLALVALLSLFSCTEDKYPAKESTESEARTVMTVEIDGESYNIKYELYRALFLAARSSVDGGDASVWSGADKENYVAQIDAVIKSRIAEIYSVFHVAKKIGIDVYSSRYDALVKDYVTISVEGGYYNDVAITGFGGDYDKYLAYLAENYMNYSVQDLLLRYSVAMQEIYEYYAGTLNSEYLPDTQVGKLEYTRDDVLNFYNSDECVRVLRAFLPDAYFTRERAESIRETLVQKSALGDDAVAAYMISQTTTGATDIKNGEIIARHNLDTEYYAELVEAAFGLKTFEVSAVLETTTGTEDGYAILYKTVKNSSHFEECYDGIAAAYVQNEIGKIIDTATISVLESLKPTRVLEEIDRSNITME